jgi:hypothetical protein
MPTMTKPSTLIADLYQVVTQVEEDKAAGQGGKTNARALRSMASKITDIKDEMVGAGITSDIDATVTVLNEWADTFAPDQVELTWNKDEVANKLKVLDGLAGLEMLTETESEQVGDLKEKLAGIAKGGTGQRAPRTDAERIEGRPELVTVTDPQGNQIAAQAGNLPNSASNIKTRIVKYIVSTLPEGTTLSDEDSKSVLTAVKTVTEGGKDSAEVFGLTIAKGVESAEDTPEA